MLVRKSVFARFAASASSRASRSAASRSFNEEMSLAISMKPPSFDGTVRQPDPAAVRQPHLPVGMGQHVVDFRRHPFTGREGVRRPGKNCRMRELAISTRPSAPIRATPLRAPSIALANWLCAERRAAISRSIIWRMLSRMTVIEASNRPSSSLPPGRMSVSSSPAAIRPAAWDAAAIGVTILRARVSATRQPISSTWTWRGYSGCDSDRSAPASVPGRGTRRPRSVRRANRGSPAPGRYVRASASRWFGEGGASRMARQAVERLLGGAAGGGRGRRGGTLDAPRRCRL